MKIKAVVVDDDFSALKAIKNYCEQLNLEVIEAYDSPKKFLDAVDGLKFDIAILDYAMPQYNGLQLAEILNSKNIPIIFVTGHRDEIASKAWDLNCIAPKTRRKRGVDTIIYKDPKKKELHRFSDLISSHTMRRTAITTMLCLEMPEAIVRKISGHAPHSKEFFRYLEISQRYLDTETEKMHSKLEQKLLSI